MAYTNKGAVFVSNGLVDCIRSARGQAGRLNLHSFLSASKFDPLVFSSVHKMEPLWSIAFLMATSGDCVV